MPAATVHKVLAETFGPAVAATVRVLRRQAGGGGLDRPGASCGLEGRHARSRSRSSTRAPAQALAVRPQPGGPDGPDVRVDRARARRRPLRGRAQGAGGGGARLHPRADLAGGVRRGLRRGPEDRRARGGRTAATRCWSPPGWTARPLSDIISTGTQERTRPRRVDCYLRFLFASPGARGAAARRPAPGQLPACCRTAASASSTSAPSTRLPDGLPSSTGDCCARRCTGTPRRSPQGLRDEGFIRPASRSTRAGAGLPRAVRGAGREHETFHFTRAWMQSQFKRINDPRQENWSTGLSSTCRRSTSSIHRVWARRGRRALPARRQRRDARPARAVAARLRRRLVVRRFVRCGARIV